MCLGILCIMWVSRWVSLFEVGINPTIKATNILHMGDMLEGDGGGGGGGCV